MNPAETEATDSRAATEGQVSQDETPVETTSFCRFPTNVRATRLKARKDHRDRKATTDLLETMAPQDPTVNQARRENRVEPDFQEHQDSRVARDRQANLECCDRDRKRRPADQDCQVDRDHQDLLVLQASPERMATKDRQETRDHRVSGASQAVREMQDNREVPAKTDLQEAAIIVHQPDWLLDTRQNRFYDQSGLVAYFLVSILNPSSGPSSTPYCSWNVALL